ncbi:hypothetical protein VTI74DRAFT_5277 [Chaetomium olivicolor]
MRQIRQCESCEEDTPTRTKSTERICGQIMTGPTQVGLQSADRQPLSNHSRSNILTHSATCDSAAKLLSAA